MLVFFLPRFFRFFRPRISSIFSTLLLVLLCLLGCCLPAWAWQGLVIRVLDGDTLLLAPEDVEHTDISVRLYGIDAPELAQEGGKEAAAALQALAPLGARVNVVSMAQDRFGRVVGLVSAHGENFNYAQIQHGHAWVDPRYCKARFCSDWNKAESAARHQQRGLWHTPAPLPPWAWRTRHKP